MNTQSSDDGGRGRLAPLLAVALGLVGLVLIFTGASRPASAPGVGAGRSGVAMVLTARAVPAGATLAPADLTVASLPPGSVRVEGVVHALGSAVGRRVAVGLPSGVPLLDAVLLGDDAPAAGHRLVRIQLDQALLPPGLQSDEVVDVVAAEAGDQSTGGRLAMVATGRVVAVSGGTLTVEVDVGAADRLLWAESFAKAVRVLARPLTDDGIAPSDVDGLGHAP